MLSENLFVAAAKYHGTWTNVCCQRIKQRVDHVRQLIAPLSVRDTVHDTENLTFSKEFRGCSARTPVDSCAERRGFLHGCCGTSVQADADFPCRRAQIFRADSG